MQMPEKYWSVSEKSFPQSALPNFTLKVTAMIIRTGSGQTVSITMHMPDDPAGYDFPRTVRTQENSRYITGRKWMTAKEPAGFNSAGRAADE